MAISTDEVKKLRARTGVSIMQCKKALEDAGGDVAQAVVLLKKRAGAVADKKSDRTLGAGAVATYVHQDTVGAMVLLSSETDFVAKNEEFIALAREIAMQVAATNPKFISADAITDADREAAQKVFVEEMKDTPKEMHDKILEGKMKSYFKDMVLLDQEFIKDSSKTVTDLITEAIQKFGERIEISDIARFSARG